MEQRIIAFVTGTTQQLNTLCPQPTTQQRLILNTQTGQVFWDYNNVRYQVNTTQIQGDWDQSDSSSPEYIKNKPEVPTDISQLTDTEHKVGIAQSVLDTNTATTTASGIVVTLPSSKLPAFIKTANNMYNVQADSVAVSSNGVISLNISRYMAYQNLQTIPTNWSIIYG